LSSCENLLVTLRSSSGCGYREGDHVSIYAGKESLFQGWKETVLNMSAKEIVTARLGSVYLSSGGCRCDDVKPLAMQAGLGGAVE
jgi:hypothetical protein